MSLDQRVELRFEPTGDKYPRVVIIADGVHDVGRLIATLAHGTVSTPRSHIRLAANSTTPRKAGTRSLTWSVSATGMEAAP